MSTTDDSNRLSPGPPTDPSLRLNRAYDDPDNPSTVTFFPADSDWPDVGTTWISVDVDDALEASEWR